MRCLKLIGITLSTPSHRSDIACMFAESKKRESGEVREERGKERERTGRGEEMNRGRICNTAGGEAQRWGR